MAARSFVPAHESVILIQKLSKMSDKVTSFEPTVLSSEYDYHLRSIFETSHITPDQKFIDKKATFQTNRIRLYYK